MVETIEWTAGGVVMIDQTRLPMHEEYVTCRNYQEVAVAIRDMIIRGAPAIGVAAAMGVAIGVQHAERSGPRLRGGPHLRHARPHTPDRRQSLLGHRPHEAPLHHAARPARSRRSASASFRKRSSYARKISPSTAPSGSTARRWSRTTRPCSPTAMPARWLPPATAPRSASSAPRARAANRSTSTPMRPARFCRARASPSGNCSRTASPPP